MLGSAVPPCFTITFDGGQFVDVLVVAGAAFAGAGFGEVEAEAPVTAVGLQLELAGAFFLCRFGANAALAPGAVFAGGAADGDWDVLGACAEDDES